MSSCRALRPTPPEILSEGHCLGGASRHRHRARADATVGCSRRAARRACHIAESSGCSARRPRGREVRDRRRDAEGDRRTGRGRQEGAPRGDARPGGHRRCHLCRGDVGGRGRRAPQARPGGAPRVLPRPSRAPPGLRPEPAARRLRDRLLALPPAERNRPTARVLGGGHSVAGTNMRFRLDPTINVSEEVRIRAQINALDNVVWGSTPQYAYIQQNRVDIGILNETSVPPIPGVNSTQSNIAVTRVWGEVATPVGLLKFGRMARPVRHGHRPQRRELPRLRLRDAPSTGSSSWPSRSPASWWSRCWTSTWRAWSVAPPTPRGSRTT